MVKFQRSVRRPLDLWLLQNFDVVPLVRSYEPMKDIRREIEQRSSGAPASGGATVPAGATQVGV